jgi:hypothetical protein
MRHRCNWRNVDVWHLPQLMPMGMTQTVVLRRCVSCGLPDTITLNGRWTIEQVNGQRREVGVVRRANEDASDGTGRAAHAAGDDARRV